MKTKIPVLPAISRQKLECVLLKVPGKKDLIIDPKIIKPLENIIGISALRSLDVEKIYKLQSSHVPTENLQRVFLIYSDLISVKYVCDHINAEICKDNYKQIKFVLIVIPRKLYSIVQLLEEEGVYEHVTVFSFSWELIPLDTWSILSLELQDYFRLLFVDRNQSLLTATAKSIWSTFLIWGKPSTIVLLGTHAQLIYNMICEYFTEFGEPPDKNHSNIDYFILVDRDIDYISTLLTPATYTALLDEVFGIRSSFVEINDGLHTSLNSTDDIYNQIKNRHFSEITSYLKRKATALQADYDSKHKMKLEEMKHYIKKELQNVIALKKSLFFHISACEIIVKKLSDRFKKFQMVEQCMLERGSKREMLTFIEDCIAMNIGGEFSILRLICLLSLTQDGLSAEDGHSLKLQFLQVFGYHYLPLFHNLEKMGLFVVNRSFNVTDMSASSLASRVAQVIPLSSKKSSLYTMIQKLKLVPTAVDDNNCLKNPTDMSYVFSGTYTPAICQLVNLIIKQEITVDDIGKIFSNSKTIVNSNSSSPQNFYIYFVGGVTYAETAAFQLLEKLTGCQITIATTNLINGNDIGKSCI